jgi:predicted permease
MVGQLLRDLRGSWRIFRTAPVVAAVVIVSLGIGIGVNAAMFTWIQALALNPLPSVPHSNQFLLVEPRTDADNYPGSSWLEYRDIQQRLPSLPDLLAFRMVPFNVGQADWAGRTYGLLVSGNYFQALGLAPALGRLVQPYDASTPGAAPVAVISYDFWRSRFNGSTDVLGQIIRTNDRPLTIVGVAPEGFPGTVAGLRFDMWVPATMAAVLMDGSRELEDRGQRVYSVMGRLKPSATKAGAGRELTAAMRALTHDYPATNTATSGDVLSFWQSPRGPQRMLVGSLAMLQGVMVLLLLAVCGNTANLTLARASARQKEVSARLALGAARWRIISLLFSESLLLATLGAILGALIALWGSNAMRAVPMPTPAGLTIRFDTAVDGVTLGFAVLLGLGSAVLFGALPAIQLSRTTPNLSARSSVTPAGRSSLRDTFMAVEVALALVVLVAASVFLKSFNETQTADPGFRREGILLTAYDLRGRNRTIDSAASIDFAARLLDRLRAVPGVDGAAIASAVPLDIHGLPSRMFSVDGHVRNDGSLDQALTNTVTPGYFGVMGIPLRKGADFADLRDTHAPPQAVVNEAFVRAFLPGAEPIGRQIDTAGRKYTIVGVAANSVYEAFGEAPAAFIYLSYRDRPSPGGEIHVRTRPGGETGLMPEIRTVVRDIDPTLPLYNVRTLTEHVDTNLVFVRIPARIFVVLGPLLLALAAIGIYAVVAYTITQRTPEIGIRLALGATSGRVVGQLIAETLRVIAVGGAAGWVIAYLVNRDVRQASLDPVPFAGVPAVLLLVATIACWLPARHAARIDPMRALKD